MVGVILVTEFALERVIKPFFELLKHFLLKVFDNNPQPPFCLGQPYRYQKPVLKREGIAQPVDIFQHQQAFSKSRLASSGRFAS
jgi:hypothetical protein